MIEYLLNFSKNFIINTVFTWASEQNYRINNKVRKGRIELKSVLPSCNG